MSSASLFSDTGPPNFRFSSICICYNDHCVVFWFPRVLSCLLISLLFFWSPTYPVILCKFCLFSLMRLVSSKNLKLFYHHAGGMACPFQIRLKLLIASSVGLNTSEKNMHPCLALCQPEPCCKSLVL